VNKLANVGHSIRELRLSQLSSSTYCLLVGHASQSFAAVGNSVLSTDDVGELMTADK